MKNLLLTVFLFTLLTASAQEKTPPDYENIKITISDSSSSYYYPLLLEKYKNSPKQMTLEEKRHLYYGFIYQEGYTPYESSSHEKKIQEILKQSEITEDDYRAMVHWADLILEKNPFDTYALQWKTVALFKLGQSDDIQYDVIIAQFNIIMDAIVSSGNGKELKTAYYVTDIQHEYALLGYFDYKPAGQWAKEFDTRFFDYIVLGENSDDVEGIYFDITPAKNQFEISYHKKKAAEKKRKKQEYKENKRKKS